jgi:hypothetical protein
MKKETLFPHRLVNPDTADNPASTVGLVDNLSEALDYARGMASGLYAIADMIGAEFDEGDIKWLAGALSAQIQDAQALLDTWSGAYHGHAR